jgi:hypothetical protein
MTGSDAAADAFQRYLAALEGLTPATLPALSQMLAEDVRFTDPFHDVQGRAAMCRVLGQMFDDLQQVRFVVAASAIREQVGFMSWTLAATARRFGARSLVLRGASEIRLGSDGLVVVHIDYWDAAHQLYERLPLLAPVLRTLRRRIARTTD